MPYSHLTNSVLSSENLTKADLETLAKPVSVRDGDDSIRFELPKEEEEEHAESRMEIKINTTDADDDDDDEELSGEGAGEPEGDDIPDFHKVDPKSLEEASEVLAEATTGHQEIIAEAIEKGLTQEQVQSFQDEYDAGGGLSDKSYKALEALGYTKAFVNSFMAGQQSVADNFVRELVGYCGGQASFTKLTAFISANQPETAKAFDAAVERNDVTTIKALLSGAQGAMRQSFGKQPKRNLAANAKPVNTAPAPKQVEGFTSRAEMVKAMGDVRYQRDPVFRREVELKVFHAKF